MSRRQTALEELRTRLQTISRSAGFQTDAGQLVFLGERPVLGENDPAESLAIIVQEDTPTYTGENVATMVPVDVQAVVRADVDDPHRTVEAILSDIKTAVETDHDLGGSLVKKGLTRGSTRPLDRQDGSTFVGVQVRYNLEMFEKWGAP